MQFTRLLKQNVQTAKNVITWSDKYHRLPKDATVFSMIQPTGPFHIGNYLGALQTWKRLNDEKAADDKAYKDFKLGMSSKNDPILQGDSHVMLNEQKLVFGIADLHAITIFKKDTKQFNMWRWEALAGLLSMGISPDQCIVFFQSSVPQHSQLHWIFSTITSVGQLNRMTQWKSKTQKLVQNTDNIGIDSTKLGLFAYPVLQAADILLYKSTHVPIGEDQLQHLELTRDIAVKFNNSFNERFFPLPVSVLAPHKKIGSLSNPTKKMSKSDGNAMSLIYITDSPELIQRKVSKALTDNISDSFYYDVKNRPGVSNLIDIVSGLTNMPVKKVEEEIAKYHTYKDFKRYVSEVIIESLKETRDNYTYLLQNKDYLSNVAQWGKQQASVIAERNMAAIMELVGFGGITLK